MIKKLLLKIYYAADNSPERTDGFQKAARDCEWEAVQGFVKKGRFLDVGCGTGYAMKLAGEMGCDVTGIDPEPMKHGVGRTDTAFVSGSERILKAVAENIPFHDHSFDTVYSSHVLEHVNEVSKSLREMQRVVKEDGVIIIGVPTATMAWINWLTQSLFTTHQKIVNVLFSGLFKTGKTRWWEIFIAASHSCECRTIIDDLKNYREKIWLEKIGAELKVKKILRPCLYSYPEYRQFFKLRKNCRYSSSIFFICSK